ncbi:hypothetical protein [Burkholderia gladioli]|uniref:hypothetical protein n=1 Tax=Burkholderia gladioli TaxID=28095 RepID=UPI003B98245E
MRNPLGIAIYPFLMYVRAIRRISEISENEDATKAILDFFRNLAMVLAIGAAGIWLIDHPGSGPWWRADLRIACGIIIMMVSVALNLMLTLHAQRRLMDKAGMSRRQVFSLMTTCIVVSALGLLDYLTSK